jgi:formylglycine-generating enzyme required for sulfatase activity
MNMTYAEAEAFAQSLGGRIPTFDEWDHAAGLFDRQKLDRPIKPAGTARIGLDKPHSVKGEEAERTKNQFNLIDMAGNGREWTSTVFPDNEPRRRMVLRGRNYTLPTPLTYADMEEQRKEPRAQYADVPSPYTGFRVVLPLP